MNFPSTPGVLLERGKVSQKLLKQAAAAGMTMGCEMEFYVRGIGDIFRRSITRGSQQHDGRLFKPLASATWHDMVLYFAPIGMGEKEMLQDDDTVMLRRLTYVYRKVTSKEPTTERKMFDALVEKFDHGRAVLLLGLFPHEGFLVETATNKLVRDRIEQFRVHPTQGLMDWAKNMNDVDFVMTNTFGSTVDEFTLDPTSPKRLVALEILAEMIAEYLGEPVVASIEPDLNPAKSEGYTKWLLTIDPSLKDHDDWLDTIGVELVAPISDIKTGVDNLRKAFRLISGFGACVGRKTLSAFTTRETGLHVNLGLGDRRIDPAKLLFMIGDDHVLAKFKRRGNIHAAASFNAMLASIRRNPANMDAIARAVEQQYPMDHEDIRFVLGRLKDAIEVKKTMSVNLEKLPRHVEFRAMGNKGYEKRGDDIDQIVRQFVTMIFVSSDPELYRKEYLSKVFRVIQGMVQHYRGPVQRSLQHRPEDAMINTIRTKVLRTMLAQRFQGSTDVGLTRAWGEVRQFLERYERTGMMNVYAFKQAGNNLLTAFRRAGAAGAFVLAPGEMGAVQQMMAALREIATGAGVTRAA